MGRKATILIVDSNPGFALMLKESLEQAAHCRATVVPTGPEALDAATSHPFDLAIVDLGIRPQNDVDGETVARRLREANPDLPLVLIPLQGDELPDNLSDLKVQGTLPKPFFLPDLPGLLEAALGTAFAQPDVPEKPEIPAAPEVVEEASVPPGPEVSGRPEIPEGPELKEAPDERDRPAVPEQAPVPGQRASVSERRDVPPKPPMPDGPNVPELEGDTRDPAGSQGGYVGAPGGAASSRGLETWSPAATAEIENLARQVNADAVMVTNRGDVVACVGRIREDRQDALGKSIWRACQLSRMAARSLGREQTDFEQAVEGEDYLLYTLTIEDGVLLSAVLRCDTTLGFLRHQTRGTAQRLRAALNVSGRGVQ